jgi:hypothetical protein
MSDTVKIYTKNENGEWICVKSSEISIDTTSLIADKEAKMMAMYDEIQKLKQLQS